MFSNMQIFGTMKIRVKEVKVRIFTFFSEISDFPAPKTMAVWSISILIFIYLKFPITFFSYLCLGLYSPPHSPERMECLEPEGKSSGLLSRKSSLTPPPFIRKKLKPRVDPYLHKFNWVWVKLCFSHSFHCTILVLKTDKAQPFLKSLWPI